MAIALIVAAGTGERLGADRPKALVELAGRPLFQWSLCTLHEAAGIDKIALAIPRAYTSASGVSELSIALPSAWNAVVVPGGATRSESVRLALAAAGPGDPVLVHDAARPLLTTELVAATLAAVEREGVDAAIAATPVTDTIKRAASTWAASTWAASTFPVGSSQAIPGESGPPLRSLPVVGETLDRTVLWAAQTPQVFRRDMLERALDVPDDVLAQATDDAWLVERSGGRVVVVPAPPENLKVTTALDLALAELLIARRED